jgi:hypothetical protein
LGLLQSFNLKQVGESGAVTGGEFSSLLSFFFVSFFSFFLFQSFSSRMEKRLETLKEKERRLRKELDLVVAERRDLEQGPVSLSKKTKLTPTPSTFQAMRQEVQEVQLDRDEVKSCRLHFDSLVFEGKSIFFLI